MECYECKRKDVHTRTCEIHNPEHARVCKDCCISRMKGHKCVWFELCWSGAGDWK